MTAKRKIVGIVVGMAVLLLTGGGAVWGAVGCTLNNPDRDILRLFPKASNYKTEFITIEERGGQELAREVEAKLGDELEPRYEGLDVPYAYYRVLRGKEVIGYVHGVNQKGKYGGMQLILATDPCGVIQDFYYQKLTSPEAKAFRDEAFTGQFTGLSLADFYRGSKALKKIEDPSEKNEEDFRATMRGIFKNLILHDEFMLDNRYDKVLEEMKEEKARREGSEEQSTR